MIYAKISQNQIEESYNINFFGEENNKNSMAGKFLRAEPEDKDYVEYNRFVLSWLAENDFIPISETFFYKQ